MPLTKDFDQAFGHLLTAWNHHQELKRNGAEIPELYRSRSQLDLARFDARIASRRATV